MEIKWIWIVLLLAQAAALCWLGVWLNGRNK